METEGLNISPASKRVFRDFYLGCLDGFAYRDFSHNIQDELKTLGIYEMIEGRIEKKLLAPFILNKDYFVDVGLLDIHSYWILDASYTLHYPDLDIILLGEHVNASLSENKKSSLHEVLHVYFFRNHSYLKKFEEEFENETDSFNRKIDGLKEIQVIEYMAKLIPFLFPSIKPAYGEVILTKEAEKIAEISKKNIREVMKILLHVKTLDELEKELQLTS